MVSKDCNLFITDRRRLDQTEVLLTTPKADMVLLEISKYDEMVVSEVFDGKGANDQKLIEECRVDISQCSGKCYVAQPNRKIAFNINFQANDLLYKI